MKVTRTIAELQSALDRDRRAGRRIGLVPTMGALHAGHLSLLELARRTAETVVVSIFVNPLQFGPAEDLDRYPRDESGDLRKCEREGVDVVFVPTVGEMYPSGTDTTVAVGELGAIYEGAVRPGHFNGVATVVSKLFNIVRPDVAFFGQKDAQQIAVIKRLVRDLSYPIEIGVGPTVRDPDGLALSSRIAYLSAGERSAARSLFRSLSEARDLIQKGGSPEVAAKEMERMLGAEPEVDLDYAIAVDPDGFGPPVHDGPVLLAVAARVGTTRLIDNLLIER